MAKPATDTRLRAAADGLTDVLARGRSSLLLANPSTAQRRFAAQGGNSAWHKRDGTTEIDSAWEPADGQNPPQAPNGDGFWYQMRGADYAADAGRTAALFFNASQLIRYRAAGEWIDFTPHLIQYRNDGAQVETIATPAAVPGTVIDDRIEWPAAYGTGFDFRWIADAAALIKYVTIAALPPPAAYILAGVNPVLELRLDFELSAGVECWVRGQAGYERWDMRNNSERVTDADVEFRLASNGSVAFFFKRPTARDAGGSFQGPACDIRMKGTTKGVELFVRVPWSWLETAVYPILIDPQVTDQVSDNTQDLAYNDTLWLAGETAAWVSLENGEEHGTACRFATGGVLEGQVDSAFLIWKCHNARSDDVPMRIGALDAADHPGPASKAEFDAAPKTSEIAFTFTQDTVANEWYGKTLAPTDIASIFQQLVDTYGPLLDHVVLYQQGDGTSGTLRQVFRQHNYAASDAPQLEVNFTLVVAGQGAMAAAGSLAATGAMKTTGQAALSGAGMLAAASIVMLAETAVLTAAGALVAASKVTAAASASLSGAGVVAAASAVVVVETAVLTANGAVMAVGLATTAGSTAIAGAGLITAAGQIRVAETAVLTATAGLAATGSILGLVTGAVGLAAIGTITAVPHVEIRGYAALDATDTLATSAQVIVRQIGSLTAAGSLAASGQPIGTTQGAVLLAAVVALWATGRARSQLPPLSPAQLRRLRHRCVIAEVDPTQTSSRITLLTDLPCTPLYPLDARSRERWQMATTTRAFRTYVQPPGMEILARTRLLIGGTDYRIREATPIPAEAPRLVELILDDEGL